MTTVTTAPSPRAPRNLNVGTTSSQNNNYVKHALVLAKRSLYKTLRTPESLIDVTLQPIIFLLMFVYIFGGAISGGSPSNYIQFLVPGLLGQTIAMASIAVGQYLNSDIDKGVFDRFRSLPIGRSVPLVGVVLADLVRYLVLFVILISTALLMGFDVGGHWGGVFASLALAVSFALCFCWVSVWVGMTVRTPGAVQGVMFMIVFPLSFGSSAFVPVSTMPGWLQAFVHVNPITHVVDAVRGLMLGGPVAGPIMWTLVSMGVLLVVFVPLAMRAYKRRM